MVPAREFSGDPARIVRELFANVSNPRGSNYQLIPADDSLTFAGDTFAVLLDGPIPPAAVRQFETALENELRPLLGELTFFTYAYFLKPSTHRRRRRDLTVELRRVWVGGVY